MKKFLCACVLALPFIAASQQNASACGIEINWSGGFDWHCCFGINCGRSCIGGGCAAPVYGYDGGAGYAGSPWGGDGTCMDGSTSPGYGSAWMPFTTQPLTSTVAQPTMSYGGYGFQPVSYTGAPAYWYGR